MLTNVWSWLPTRKWERFRISFNFIKQNIRRMSVCVSIILFPFLFCIFCFLFFSLCILLCVTFMTDMSTQNARTHTEKHYQISLFGVYHIFLGCVSTSFYLIARSEETNLDVPYVPEKISTSQIKGI